MTPRVKICCIESVEEAKLAIEFGASALGLVGAMPSGPGVISDREIFEIAQTTPPLIATFLLTSETKAARIIEHHKRTLTNTIQIVDQLDDKNYGALRNALPGIKLVQVIHILNESSVEEALEVSEMVDAILLDSGNPFLKVMQLGGTGRTHNWRLSREIVAQCAKPVFLAGGIDAGNVRQAIDEVAPFGLDLCSGVRTDGMLDAEKLAAFFREVRKI